MAYRYFCIVITFFVIGAATTFIEPLLPFLKVYLHLDYAQLMLFNTAFFISYFLFAYLSGKLVSITGIKYGLILGNLLIFSGLVAWIIALQNTTLFIMFLFATMLIGCGVVILFMITQFNALFISGTRKTSQLSILQSAHALGCFMAPLLVSYFLYHQSDPFLNNDLTYLKSILYTSMVVMVCLLLILSYSHFSEKLSYGSTVKNAKNSIGFYLNWFSLFVYVGVEISIASFIISQGTVYYNIPIYDAKWLLALYWLFIILGRVLAGFIMKQVHESKLFSINTMIGCLVISFSILIKHKLSLLFLATLGLINAPIFPIIYSLGLSDQNKSNIKTSGIMASAIFGGGVIPLIAGILTDINLNMNLLIILFGYVYLFLANKIGLSLKKILLEPKLLKSVSND